MPANRSDQSKLRQRLPLLFAGAPAFNSRRLVKARPGALGSGDVVGGFETERTFAK